MRSKAEPPLVRCVGQFVVYNKLYSKFTANLQATNRISPYCRMNKSWIWISLRFLFWFCTFGVFCTQLYNLFLPLLSDTVCLCLSVCRFILLFLLQLLVDKDEYIRLWISPPYCRAELYAGHVSCCPLVSHGEYANGTDRRTDAKPLHYAFR